MANQPLKRYDTGTSTWVGIASGSVSDGTTEYKPSDIVSKTSSSLIYYVNNTTGSDTNTGLSTSVPLKTRVAALAKINQVINDDTTIIMMTGEAGILTLEGYSGKKKLTIKGQTTTSTNYAINGVVIRNCNCSISIENMAIFNSGGPNIDILGCTDVYIGNVTIPQSNTAAGVQAFSSNVTVTSCAISNQTYGIVSTRSTIYSYNNTGTGNTLALVADQAGTIGKGGTQPSGTTAELQQNGGVIR